MGTIPTTPTFTAGEKLTAAKLEQVSDAIDFWSLTPRCMAYATAAQTLTTSGTFYVVALDSEIYDVYQSGDTASHDATTDNSRIYIRTTGKYEITGAVEFAVNATGARTVCINKNAAGNQASGTMLVTQTQSAVSGVVTSAPLPVIEASLTAGDYVEMFARQTSGGSLNTGFGLAQTWMRVKLTGS